ncbi:calcium-binding protein [Pilimelia terevasa]|uniref:calcium-binding protein n=1 Tax=Pilimelia terevasa TaxID=53372 RepID=UPI00166CD46A|nr:calcium-binding protein [Pilimelia terevasa]
MPARLTGRLAAVAGTALLALVPAPPAAASVADLRPTVRLVGGTCGFRHVQVDLRFWDDHTPHDRLAYALVHQRGRGMFAQLSLYRAGLQTRISMYLAGDPVGVADLVVAVADTAGNTRRFPVTVRAGYLGMTGTARSDVMIGDNRSNVLRGMGGNDLVCGLGRGDTIDGGPGDDLVDGGDGHDRVAGGEGRDVVQDCFGYGRYDDVLDGGPGDDVLRDCGGGDDTLRGGPGADVLDAGIGADELDGGAGPDRMTGGPGPDRFVATAEDTTDFDPAQGDHT